MSANISTPTGSETITILYPVLRRQGMQNVVFGLILYFIKHQAVAH